MVHPLWVHQFFSHKYPAISYNFFQFCHTIINRDESGKNRLTRSMPPVALTRAAMQDNRISLVLMRLCQNEMGIDKIPYIGYVPIVHGACTKCTSAMYETQGAHFLFWHSLYYKT